MSIETRKQEDLGAEYEAPRSGGRQKWSTLEKTAFWTSLVMTVLLIAIAFIVKALSGITSQALIVASILGAVSTVLLAFRNRWTALAATVLNGYLFYLIWTEPFVVESLGDPKGPDGGLGHFSGDVMVICCSIIVFVCCLGISYQHFRGASRQTPRWYPVLMSLVIGLFIGALHIGAISLPPAASGGLTLTNGVPTIHMTATGFLQSSVTIAKGSKLILEDDSTEEHDLFNGSWQGGNPVVSREAGAPVLNDVVLKNNSVTIGPFTTAGTYHIFCSIHQGMNLTIIVQ